MKFDALKPNVFKVKWKPNPAQAPKTVHDPLPAMPAMRVRVMRSHSYGGYGWLDVGFPEASYVGSTPKTFPHTAEAVKKLSQIRGLICGEVEFIA